MIKSILKYFNLILLLAIIICSGCNNSPVSIANTETLVYDSLGIIDSAVVYGCYEKLEQFYIDTNNFSIFNKLKITIQGNTNSDGTYIECLVHNSNYTIQSIYKKENIININKIHTIEFNKPVGLMKIELRIYIKPPVCGQGEFKFTSIRNLNVYGIQ